MAKTSGSKKAAAAKKKKLAELVWLVFGECGLAVGRGVERVACEKGAAGSPGYVTIATRRAAISIWAKKYSKTIPKGVKTGNWIKDRGTVLIMAELLGVEAAKSAIASTPAGKPVEIKAADVRAASKKIEKNATCKAPNSGSGIYCQD